MPISPDRPQQPASRQAAGNCIRLRQLPRSKLANGDLKYLLLVCLLYGIPNLVAFVTAYWFDLLVVDMVPLTLRASEQELVLAASLVLASFIFVTAMARRGSRRFGSAAQWIPRQTFGIFLFVLQLLGLLSLLLYGYGRASKEAESVNLLVTVTSYLKSDVLFLLYYGQARIRFFPKYNFALYALLATLRGWSGIWLIILLIELYYTVVNSRGALRPRTLLLVGIAAVLAFPLLAQLRDTIRGDVVNSDVGELPYFRLLNRLDHLSNVVLISQDSNELTRDYQRGRINPWYTSTVTTLAGVVSFRYSETLQRYLTGEYLIDKNGADPFADDSRWHTQIGIAGWIFLLPAAEAVIYLIYVALLIYLPYWIAATFLKTPSIIPVIHVASFGFVLHGWLEVQVAFIGTVLLYVALLRFCFGRRINAPARSEAG